MRFVLSGYFGFKNFGDEAILSVLVNKLQEYNHKITVISSNPDYTKSKFKHIRSVNTFKFGDIIGAIAKSDCLISGGGSLLQDVTSTKSLFYYLFIILIALIFRKKVIIFSQGIGPINNNFGRFFTRLILRKCDYISVRDNKSFELMQKWGIKADLVCDPVFDVKIENCEKNDVVAVQLRGFKTLTQDFIDRLAEAICRNFPDKTIEIYSFQDNIDLEVCKDFERNLKLLNPDIKTVIYNDNIINRLAKTKYLIAMRFHAIIIGLISKVKIMGINYDIKVEKICEEFDLPLLDLAKSFENQFDLLKTQNSNRDLDKEYDWTNFLRVINK